MQVTGLRKAYGDKVVLRDIDLEVEPNDVVCLIGSSGSGKSTLLRCLNLLETVDDGAILFEGNEITDPRVDARAVRRRMGMVFQAYNLFPHLTVLENVTLAPRQVHGVGRRPTEAAAHELLARFALMVLLVSAGVRAPARSGRSGGRRATSRGPLRATGGRRTA